MTDSYRPAAESAALDQAGAFIREESDREKVAILVAEDKVFCAGVSFALGMMVRLSNRDELDLPLPLFDLADAWQDLVGRRYGA